MWCKSSRNPSRMNWELLFDELVKVLGSLFYKKEEAFVLAKISNEKTIDRQTLVNFLQWPKKKIDKVLTKLCKDRLICANDENSVFYIDKPNFINLAKWRMLKMEQTLGHHETAQENARRFECPKCKKDFDMLTAVGFGFKCDEDLEDLGEMPSTFLSARDHIEKVKDFHRQTEIVTGILKELDKIPLPMLDEKVTLELHDSDEDEIFTEVDI